MATRMKQINPSIEVDVNGDYFMNETAGEMLGPIGSPKAYIWNFKN